MESVNHSKPTPEQFAHLVMAKLRELGDDRSASLDADAFRLNFTRDGEDVGLMHLSNIYAEYANADESDRPRLLHRTCIGFISKFDTPEDFDDVKPDVLPTIRVRSTEEQMRLDQEIAGGKWTPFASVPLSDHLEVFLVYDLPERMEFWPRERFDEWGVSLFEAAEIAKQNLAERDFRVGLVRDKVFVVITGDAYDAARMLLLDHIRQLPVVGQRVAMPVNRDSLLIAGSDDPDALGIMAELTDEMLEEPRPICWIPHMLVGDEWVPWRPPPDHPHHEKFRLLSLKHYGRDYDEQKKQLDLLHKNTGEDVFVADLFGDGTRWQSAELRCLVK